MSAAFFFFIMLILFLIVLVSIIVGMTKVPKDFYRFGCIVAILYCILVLVGLFKWSWIWFILSYIAGMLLYNRIYTDNIFFGETEKVSFNESKNNDKELELSKENNEILNIHKKVPEIKMTRHLIQEQERMEIEKNALFLLIDLKAQVRSELNFNQNKLLNEIHDVFAGLQQKINQTSQKKSQSEIEAVLRTSLELLKKSIEEYIQYPKNQRYYPSEQHAPSPQIWLTQQLEQMLEQLIEVAELLYKKDLESIHSHNEFILQQLKPNHFFKVGKYMGSE